MTRHNLDEQLSWLLRTKATLPPTESPFSPVNASFTAIGVSQETQEETQAAEAQRPLLSTAAAPSPARLRVRDKTPQLEEMVRLRTVPGSGSRQNLVSMGPDLPRTGANVSLATPTLSRMPPAPMHSISKATPRRQETLSAHRHGIPSPRNVEVMDLTESPGRTQSPTPAHNIGRKRKSSEMEAGTTLEALPHHAARTRPPADVTPPRASQQSFTAIDEIMDEQPFEPPPPYSTLAPKILNAARSVSGASASTSRQAPPTLPDSEGEDDNDDLINLSGRRPQSRRPLYDRVMSLADNPSPEAVTSTEATGKKTPHIEHSKVATPAASRHAEHLVPPMLPEKVAQQSTPVPTAQESANPLAAVVRDFFELSHADVQRLVESLHVQHENICVAITERLEDGLDDKDLEEKQIENLDLQEAIRILARQRDEHQRLKDEKQHAHSAMQHAVRTRQGKEAATQANLAAKRILERFETKCCGLFSSCTNEFERVVQSMSKSVDGGNRKTVAVQSTQAPLYATTTTGLAIPSSSRIAQTQVPAYTARQPPVPTFPHLDSLDHRGIATRRDEYDDGFDDVDEAALCDASNNIFSNRMGTPPAPYDNDDDFGMNDDEDMLELAEDYDNHAASTAGSAYQHARPAFAEVSSNVRTLGTTNSTKKPKKGAMKFVESEEESFRYPWSEDVVETLRHSFGLKGFRENQLEAVNATLDGKDVFVLMPTGGGKSLCYQLPALISSGRTQGVTIVVSPLMSLMEDQVTHLRKLDIQAFFINSATSKSEKSEIVRGLNMPDAETFVQILYVTPEMLSVNMYMVDTIERLYKRNKLARLVIDEAHCVSQWGHDFRPDYKLLGDFRRKLPRVPVMALTATATDAVKFDTMHNLGIDGCQVLSSSFNRENLFYEVLPKSKGSVSKIAELIQEKHSRKTGIIYCFSRKNCESVAEELRKEHNIEAQHYHAGMDTKKKSEVQKMWQAGECHVIVATIAFGMGIDKPDVRFVIHHSIPKSLEGYYQETGRAGRDGKKSHCYLFYCYSDAAKVRRMIDEDKESDFAQKKVQCEMLRHMVQFCENKSDCRRAQVLGYFSEKFHPSGCHKQCDNCNSESTFETVDFTEYAQLAVSLVRQLSEHKKDKELKATKVQCIDILRGSSSRLREQYGEFDEWGAAQGLDRGDVERLVHRLLSEDVLSEVNVANRSGFAHSYIKLGRRKDEYAPGRGQLNMQIRSTPRPRPKAPPKKRVKKATSSKAGGRSELPMSTNVSSPIHAAATRKRVAKTSKPKPNFSGYEYDGFIVPDPEDDADYGDDAGETDSDDGFEPVRLGGVQRVASSRPPGPPITSDNMMDKLDDVHRGFAEDFIDGATKRVKELMLQHGLTVAPFSELALRRMIVNFADTPEKMLRLPGVDAEKYRLYGNEFLRMVKKARQSYEDAMQDEPAPDPHARNVVEISSDGEQDDAEDEYGSDIECDEDEEHSSYFPPADPRVQEFNSRISQTQAAARTGQAQQQKFRKGQGKGKGKGKGKGNGGWKVRRVDTTTAAGGGRPRQSYETVGDSARVTKKRSGPKRSASGGTQQRLAVGRGAGGGTVFGMMPT